MHRLLMGDGFTGMVGACPSYGDVIARPARCPVSDARARQVSDLHGHLMDFAEDQGAHVELVSGEAAAMLAPHNGVGTWTRH